MNRYQRWGINEAFKTLAATTRGSHAAKGAMRYLRKQLEGREGNTMTLLDELRAEISELASAVHDMRGDPSISWQEDLPDTAALLERIDAAEDTLARIYEWADAYPLDVFPEPNFRELRVTLERQGISLDCISAANMRHVITRVRDMLTKALEPKR